MSKIRKQFFTYIPKYVSVFAAVGSWKMRSVEVTSALFDVRVFASLRSLIEFIYLFILSSR